MVKVVSGVDKEGKPLSIYMNHLLKEALDGAIRRNQKNWDYVAIISGLPGVGKSSFARGCARYCCPWFDEKYIAFTSDDFIRITNECPEYSSVVLDESFASLNSKVSMSSDFLTIINHLQLLRQKHLFIFLCLPNFFDLSKGVAIFRSSHLFFVYSDDDGSRGRFAAFGRDQKRKLYVLGSKFLDYSAAPSNFIGQFTKNSKIVDEDVYEKMKREHLLSQTKEKIQTRDYRNEIIVNLKYKKGWSTQELSDLTGLTMHQIRNILRPYAKNKANGQESSIFYTQTDDR